MSYLLDHYYQDIDLFTFVLMFALTSKNRYLPPKTVNRLLKGFENFQSLSNIGKSVNCLPIYGLKVFFEMVQ